MVDVDADLDDFTVEQRGRDIVLEQTKKFGRGRSFDVRVRAPPRSRARGSRSPRPTSAPVASSATRGSGRRAATSSSGTVDGRLDVTTASGDVVVGSAGGGGSIRSASGDVVVGESHARLSVNTASGDLSFEAVVEGALDLKSASGDMRIGIRQGSRFRVDARSLSGETSLRARGARRRDRDRRSARRPEGGVDERRHPHRPGVIPPILRENRRLPDLLRRAGDLAVRRPDLADRAAARRRARPPRDARRRWAT